MLKKPTIYDRRSIHFAGLGELIPAFDAIWFLVGAPPNDDIEAWHRATSDLAVAITVGTIVAYVRRSLFESPSPIFRRRVSINDLWPSIRVDVPLNTPMLEFFFLCADVELVCQARIDPEAPSEFACVLRESYKKAIADPTRCCPTVWGPPIPQDPLQALRAVILRLDTREIKATADDVRTALLGQYPRLFRRGPTEKRWLLVGEGSWTKQTLRSNISKTRKQLKEVARGATAASTTELSTENVEPLTEDGEAPTAK